jgi:signal transduction histidine kinase
VTAGSSGRIRLANQSDSSDEIGDLARAFNGMADQVNHLRDALADSAYMTGLSEWAAGTLHNVRNGLVPVASMTWQIDKLFDTAWLKNVGSAVREVADDNTPPERRQKLNAFMAASGERFLEAAASTKDLVEKINEAGQNVLDMVAEFERYAHRKTELAPVDIGALLSDVTQSVIGACNNNIDVKLPHDSATVHANDVILRQVIANVFVNAIEAMSTTAQRGEISVAVSADEVSDMTTLRVTDNGEGIAPERLKSIFKRGVSSRSNRSGGLGLHWCANAVRLLGGTIHAESQGQGKGSTIVISLPTAIQQLEEAA